MKRKTLLKTAIGTPLAFGTLAFVGGKLPGTMGSTMTNALQPATGAVGLVSNIAMLGWGYKTVKKYIPYKQIKKMKFKKLQGGIK